MNYYVKVSVVTAFCFALHAMDMDQSTLHEFQETKKAQLASIGVTCCNPVQNDLIRLYTLLAYMPRDQFKQYLASESIQTAVKSLRASVVNSLDYEVTYAQARVRPADKHVWDFYRNTVERLIVEHQKKRGQSYPTDWLVNGLLVSNSRLCVGKEEDIVASAYLMHYTRQLQRDFACCNPPPLIQ